MDIQKRQRISGFSLFEMTIVLVIISVVLTGLLPFITESMQSDYANTTVERMEAIDEALRDYVEENGELPCPADATIQIDDATGDFGRSDGTSGVCNDGAGLSNPSATSGTEGIMYSGIEGPMIGGMVPTKSIYLPDEFAFDGWGRRIMYHVDINLTADGSIATATEGNLTIKDSADTDRTTKAAYVILSHGPNGHGGFTLSGNKFDVDSQNAHEHMNCSCDDGMDFVDYYGTFYQHMEQYETGHPDERDYYFDDLVRFRMVSHLK